MPVVIDFARKEDIRMESGTGMFTRYGGAVAVTAAHPGKTRDLYIVSILFQFGDADAQVVQLVGKFADQFVISADGALWRGPWR